MVAPSYWALLRRPGGGGDLRQRLQPRLGRSTGSAATPSPQPRWRHLRRHPCLLRPRRGCCSAPANGIPPTGGRRRDQRSSLRSDRSTTRSRPRPASAVPIRTSTAPLCLRSLWLGGPQAGAGPQGTASSTACAPGLASRRSWPTAGCTALPTIIVHGRSDALIAPNHSSRAYYGLNRLRDGRTRPTRYYEVTNAQHLDAFNSLPGYSERFVPLHKYFIDALDLMWAHLTAGRPCRRARSWQPRRARAGRRSRPPTSRRSLRPPGRRRSVSQATSCRSRTDHPSASLLSFPD